MDVANKDEAPIITPIPQNGADGYYTTVNDMVLQKILTAHRIVSPMLLGIRTEGQLGGRTELLESQALFVANVIQPKQSDILTTFEEIFKINGYTEPIGIEQVRIFEEGEEVDVVTSIEAESGDDKQLEQEIENKENTNGEYPTNIGE